MTTEQIPSVLSTTSGYTITHLNASTWILAKPRTTAQTTGVTGRLTIFMVNNGLEVTLRKRIREEGRQEGRRDDRNRGKLADDSAGNNRPCCIDQSNNVLVVIDVVVLFGGAFSSASSQKHTHTHTQTFQHITATDHL